MKAVYFNTHGGAEVLRYGDVPDPEAPPGWVKVRVAACSLNYLDILSRRGMPGIKVELPGITGGDCAGSIAGLGAGVTGWSVGDRVLVYPPHIDAAKGVFELMGETRNGAMAEYCVCRATQLIRIPETVGDAAAACVPIAYATAYRMLFTRGRVRAGESILVLGASGGVGVACVQLAKMGGLRVTAAAGSADKCERLLRLGADEAIDYSVEAFDRAVRRKTGSLFTGGGMDVVVNFTGGDTWAAGLRCVKRGCRVLTCGATAGYDPKTDLRYIFMAEMDILGSTGFSFDETRQMLDLVADGRIRPVIDAVLPLSRAAEGIAMLEERRVFGKVVVKP